MQCSWLTVIPVAGVEEIDLYEVLEVERSASKDEVRKAYRKLALKHHPDKAAESDREAADVKFKSISQAYEILYDEDKRAAYDRHGMSAFDPSRGGGPGMDGMDMDDILNQMFGGGMGGGMGGMPGMGGMGGRSRKPRRGEDDVNGYDVTLEDLYKGKTAHFNITKNVVCGHCKGSGAKEGAKARKCETCHGQGVRMVVGQQGPMLVQQQVPCRTCSGSGEILREKEKCKKCKGNRTTKDKKPIELYIPRGSRHHDKIVIAGEADQSPNQEPGDLVFVLQEKEHEIFKRDGADLTAEIEVTLAEALCGFSRVVIKHLDGRGISITHPAGKVIKPNQVLKVPGEGMPLKRSDAKGDLYLICDVQFPEEGWSTIERRSELQKVLPPPAAPLKVEPELVDEVEYDPDGDIEEFGTTEGGEGEDWEDDEQAEGPQCAQQ